MGALELLLERYGSGKFHVLQLVFLQNGGNALCKLRPKHECKLTISRVGHRK